MNYYNHYQKQREDGLRAEDKFCAALIALGYIVIRATKWENMHEHIDLKFSEIGTSSGYLSVDVKDRKAINRGEEAQDEYVLIELKNVYGNNGWIYGSSDYICFTMLNGWLLVPTEELRKLAEPFKKIPPIKSNSKKLPNIPYFREHDMFVYIPSEDLIFLKGVIRINEL
jgi:hypothetical protein